MYYRSGIGVTGILTRWQHFSVKLGHDRHLESVTSNQKSDTVNRCLFTRGTFLRNFTPIRFETT